MRQEFTREQGVSGRVHVLRGDLSLGAYEKLLTTKRVAWDIETNGLDPLTAKIGTCQLHSAETGTFVIVGVAGARPERLPRLLSDDSIQKVFHHAPFDLSFMTNAWGGVVRNVACTKIAAKILQPQASPDRYSLKHLMLQHFGMELEKQMRFSDWMAEVLSEAQVKYATQDVANLLALYDILQGMLKSEKLLDLYERCCAFIPVHTELRLRGCPDPFSY